LESLSKYWALIKAASESVLEAWYYLLSGVGAEMVKRFFLLISEAFNS
jgi:hypothetical protein